MNLWILMDDSLPGVVKRSFAKGFGTDPLRVSSFDLRGMKGRLAVTDEFYVHFSPLTNLIKYPIF